MSSKSIEVTNDSVFITFEAILEINTKGCSVNLVNQELLNWGGPNFLLELNISNIDGNENQKEYQVIKVILNGQEKLAIKQVKSISSFKITISKSEMCLTVNDAQKKGNIKVELVGRHDFEAHFSEEIILKKPQIRIRDTDQAINEKMRENSCLNFLEQLEKTLKTSINGAPVAKTKTTSLFIPNNGDPVTKTKTKPNINQLNLDGDVDRSNFCQLQLGLNDNANYHGKTREIFLTPEISCKVKNINSDLHKKNNINNSYTKAFMASQSPICISNPLQSLRAFTMDFIVKNLILFGLLVLFQNLLSSPRGSIPMRTSLIIAAVVVVIYNLIYWIFKALENIFTWACQYSNSLTDLIDDGDQWM